MINFIALFIVFVLGCLLSWGISGNGPRGYEQLWLVSHFIGGAITCVPVVVFMCVSWLINMFRKLR